MKTLLKISIWLLASFLCRGQQTLSNEFELLLKAELKKESIKNAIVHIYAPVKGIDISFAETNVSAEDSITVETPLYTASITKMFTATAIGILRDQKRLNFDDTIAQYLPKNIINNLHVLNGKEYSYDITIAHLLQHTSGLPDYFSDMTVDGSPNIINRLLGETDKIWLPSELIQFTKDRMTPHFIPGKGYHYTDTEYVLLALIIEQISGISLSEFFQQFIFEPLGMKSSYINLRTAASNEHRPMAKFYAGDVELSGIKSLSADWGGGGVVSTTQDLICFLEAFQENKVVKKQTRLAMQNWVNETVGMEYGFGIRKVTFKNLYDEDTDLEVLGHSGATASFLWYCPQLDTYIAGSLNQLEASKRTLRLIYDILAQLENVPSQN